VERPAAPSPAPGDGEAGEQPRGRFDPRLATSPETLARIAGGPAPDYLGELEEGSATILNSRQWKYTTYFTAMRPGIYANWKPEEAYLLRDPEGTVFPARKWITYLEVVLDDRGYLKSARVLKASGLDFLDRAAVDAFKGAAPFLNPPSGLVENGEIRFAQGFVVDMTGVLDHLRNPRHR
jgi:TonB family protein